MPHSTITNWLCSFTFEMFDSREKINPEHLGELVLCKQTVSKPKGWIFF